MLEVKRFFYKNEDVDLYKTMMLASMPGDICQSEAYDQYIGRVKGKRINEILACFKQKRHTKTQGLLTNLILKVGGKYILSSK